MLRDAFPRTLSAEVEAVVDRLPPASAAPVGRVGAILLRKEPICIPHRVYVAETGESLATSRLGLIRSCIYSRHHDGHVRERHLGPLLDAEEYWVVPFVVQLVGEYVLAIHRAIYDRIGILDGVQYRDFVTENPGFLALTRQRVISYWNEYYRNEFPAMEDHPGVRAIVALAGPIRRRPAADRLRDTRNRSPCTRGRP